MINTIEILKELIRIPSFVDDKNDEGGLIAYVENFIKTKTKYKYVMQQVEGKRKNILVYNKPNPKIALFGHMDTVLPKVETERPFEPRIEGDNLYGLGSVDMKSGLAIMLKLAMEIESDELALVFSVDEEYDFKGALKLKEIKDFNPEFIINVEPTDNKILNGCRGITEFSLVVHGKSVHAGRKEFGINAIEKTVEMIAVLQKEITSMDIPDGGKSTVNLAYLKGGLLKDSGLGVMEIKSMGNVVPNYAELVVEIRIANPEVTSKSVEEKLTLIGKSLGVEISDFKTKFYLSSMLTPKSDLLAFEQAVVDSGEQPVYADISLAGYYEVQQLQDSWKSKSVVFGPSPINMSHAANEYVLISSVERAEKVLLNFVKKYTSNN